MEHKGQYPLTACDCGRPLHYASARSRRSVEHLVRTKGPTIVLTVAEGSWRVPRHYIALHGLVGSQVPVLAERYGWERVEQ